MRVTADIFLWQVEGDELELAVTLSLLETQAHPRTQLQKYDGLSNQSGNAKEGGGTTPEPAHQQETFLNMSGTCQTVIAKQDMGAKSDMKEDQCEKTKHSKSRRQRRKAGAQHVVGLPDSPSGAAPVLLWIRRDLRLCDNPALVGSLELGAPVIPVFIWSPKEEEGPGMTVAMGGACKLDILRHV